MITFGILATILGCVLALFIALFIAIVPIITFFIVIGISNRLKKEEQIRQQQFAQMMNALSTIYQKDNVNTEENTPD